MNGWISLRMRFSLSCTAKGTKSRQWKPQYTFACKPGAPRVCSAPGREHACWLLKNNNPRRHIFVQARVNFSSIQCPKKQIGSYAVLFMTPREEAFQCACATVDGTVGQTFLYTSEESYCRAESIDGHGHIQSCGNCVKMLCVSCYCFVFNTSVCDGWNVTCKNFSKRCFWKFLIIIRAMKFHLLNTWFSDNIQAV